MKIKLFVAIFAAMKFRIPRFDSKLTQVTIITIIAIILSKTAIYSLSSAFAFKSDLEVKDFRFSDIYNSVSDNPSVRQISDRVVLIAVDGCPRETIAEVIEAANSCSPAAIGVDVMFRIPRRG